MISIDYDDDFGQHFPDNDPPPSKSDWKSKNFMFIVIIAVVSYYRLLSMNYKRKYYIKMILRFNCLKATEPLRGDS